MFQAIASVLFVPLLALGQGGILPTFAASPEALMTNEREQTFSPPIDALSVRAKGNILDLAVSGFVDGTWTDWIPLPINSEQDPALKESELAIFPTSVSRVRFKGTTFDVDVHPIRVSHTPATTLVATAGTIGFQPHILSRRDWGADESFLVQGAQTTDTNALGDTGTAPAGQPGNRVQDCQTMVRNYPDEFRATNRVTENAAGEKLRWPQEYSPSVKLFVIHHTAGQVSNDPRPGVERMRALYAYHANSRGWGDIGYNYVVDEKGQIYQGRSGGMGVVAGHAYCNNVGTVGIALMGNFDVEQPTQIQMDSLQWLLDTLSKQYNIDMNTSVIFHGKTEPRIVGHRDLVSTDCPGYYAYNVLTEVLAHVQKGDIYGLISFPNMQTNYVDRSNDRRTERLASEGSSSSSSAAAAPVVIRTTGLFPNGGTDLSGRPGEEQLLTLRFQAGTQPVQRDSTIGDVVKSNGTLAVFEDHAGQFKRVTDALTLPTFVNAGASTTIRVKVQFPTTGGDVHLTLGDVQYALTTSGRRARSPSQESTYQVYTTPPVTYSRMKRLEKVETRSVASPPTAAIIPQAASRPIHRTNTSVMPNLTASVVPIVTRSTAHTIRIRLSYGLDGQSSSTAATIIPAADATVNGTDADGSPLALSISGDQCIAEQAGKPLGSGIVRIVSQNVATIMSWNRARNRYRGTLECRVINGKLTLINELPLEDYMAGLAEEDDSQPYEKQRAFAIAARTYAAYYLDPSQRKFPGMPYDGSDDPAEFQVYGGYDFESKNPSWVKAVHDTVSDVLEIGGLIIKPPYFSSDDGRTRSPAELGSWWAAFPHSEIFASKPDPWCKGMPLSGHGVGMSGCGAAGQAKDGKTGEQILQYYYPGTNVVMW